MTPLFMPPLLVCSEIPTRLSYARYLPVLDGALRIVARGDTKAGSAQRQPEAELATKENGARDDVINHAQAKKAEDAAAKSISAAAIFNAKDLSQ